MVNPVEEQNTEIKVTRIKDKWHCRLFYNKKLIDEMACFRQEDIGWCCREMLRWLDKSGCGNRFSSAARKRQIRGPYGKVIYQGQLLNQKAKAKENAAQG